MPEHDLQTLEQRHGPWAIRPETLAAMVRHLAARSDLPAALSDPPPAEAALPQASVRGGAVALIPLRGVIMPRPTFLSFLFGGGGGLLGFRQQLREAIGSDDIAAIVIDIDSPGGLVDLVPETAAEIRNARGTKPIVAVANTTAAERGVLARGASRRGRRHPVR
jgi:ClpP class serine protease